MGCTEQQCNLKGQCDGNALHLEVVDSHSACQTLCDDRQPCNYYTYHFDSGICELFDSCDNIDGDLCKDCLSGAPYCGVGQSFSVKKCNLAMKIELLPK